MNTSRKTRLGASTLLAMSVMAGTVGLSSDHASATMRDCSEVESCGGGGEGGYCAWAPAPEPGVESDFIGSLLFGGALHHFAGMVSEAILYALDRCF